MDVDDNWALMLILLAVDANLVHGKTYWAINFTTISDNVKGLTVKWTEMVTKSNHEAVILLLRSGNSPSPNPIKM